MADTAIMREAYVRDDHVVKKYVNPAVFHRMSAWNVYPGQHTEAGNSIS
jgi:hypothetical protein